MEPHGWVDFDYPRSRSCSYLLPKQMEGHPKSVSQSKPKFTRKSDTIQGDPYGRGIVYVDSKFEVAFNCKVGLLPRPVTEV